MKTLKYITTVLLTLITISVTAQPITDTIFQPTVGFPVFMEGQGPIIIVDESHYNFRTISPTLIPHSEVAMPGRFFPLARLLRRDGYVVKPSKDSFTRESLSEANILIIGSALAKENVNSWDLPFLPAFTADEIETVVSWVKEGGSLLLIAGTYGGAASSAQLAERFGIFFSNGSAFKVKDQYERVLKDWIVFKKNNGSLVDHVITRGRNEEESVDSIMTFEGQAFRFKPGTAFEPILVFKEPTMLVFAFNGLFEHAPRIRADGMLQGALLKYGKGRVAVFGEAGMFCSQITNTARKPIGMNHPSASQNAQFILNMIHWLTNILNE